MLMVSQLHGFNAGGGEHDPYWDDVVLLMHMDGANNSTSFIDVKGHTFTRSGNAEISTVQSKFGGSSFIAPNSSYGSSDYIYCAPGDSSWHVETNMTYEMWFYASSLTAGTILFGVSNPSGSANEAVTVFVGSGSTIHVQAGALSDVVSSTITLNTWHHLAVTVEAGTVKLYIDGVSQGSPVGTLSAMTSITHCVIGCALRNGTTVLPFGNYQDELRVTKGYCRYTSDFTPPSAPFPNS